MSIISQAVKFVGSKGEAKVETLFDSGASYSFINKTVANKLGNLEKLPEPLSFETASKEQYIKIKERVILDFYINDIRFSDEFLISENLSEDVIIGIATMQKWRMKLDFDNDKVIVDKKASRLILK
ncbi:MAG: retropepsin-like aspartic protease [Bacteroidota bacterium]